MCLGEVTRTLVVCDGLRDFYFFGPPLVGADAPCGATEDFASGLSPPSERLLATGESSSLSPLQGPRAARRRDHALAAQPRLRAPYQGHNGKSHRAARDDRARGCVRDGSMSPLVATTTTTTMTMTTATLVTNLPDPDLQAAMGRGRTSTSPRRGCSGSRRRSTPSSPRARRRRSVTLPTTARRRATTPPRRRRRG